jgi:proteasome accessory factor B
MSLDGVPGDEVTVDLRFPESAAGWLAGHGADLVVLEPDVLRKSVRERLLGVVDAHTDAPASDAASDADTPEWAR